MMTDLTRETTLRTGCLVTVAGCQLGVGKLRNFSANGEAEVEWFTSVAERKRVLCDVGKLTRAHLSSQTRCYVMGERDETWRMGRVMGEVGREGSIRCYEVHFPNKVRSFVTEDRLYVRCLGPASDPTDTLAYCAHDTPFFHAKRSAFIRSLIEQRAASRGLTGLISARIHLLPHQVEVVRRALEDPIQRYLLADEVGLGKTIEAGIILRQVLLDDPEARALVLVPPFLEAQWRKELEQKLCLAVDDYQVCIRPVDGVTPADLSVRWQLVIVDEAHHLAAGRRSPFGASTWNWLRDLAHRTPRLILLSATPALNHEQDFLAMLHLLEPQDYDLEDLDAFRQRVRSRQPVGNFLLGFCEGMPRIAVRAALEPLAELFPSDGWIEEQVQALQACVDTRPWDQHLADELIRAIRVHVCETYRIHRRMLRTSRAAITSQVLSLRSEAADALPVTPEYEFDERGSRAHEWIEEWRSWASNAALDDEMGRRTEVYSRTLVALVEVCGSWAPFAAQAVRYRLGCIKQQMAPFAELDDDLRRELAAAPSFRNEADILAALLVVLEDDSVEEDQIDVLIQAVRQDQKRGVRKWVVFTSFTAVAQEIVRRLRAELGFEWVATHLAGTTPEFARRAVERFREQQRPVVLVCDRSGEEGLNLQQAERLIHFDLPFQPNRIEQRIGRLDRIGRAGEVHARVFVGPECDDSLYDAWFTILSEGFRVFSQSVSDLQFFIDRELPRIRQAMLRNGATGLRELLEDLKAGVEQERELLREQSSLDEIDAFDREAADLFQSLQAKDGQDAQLQDALEGWAVGALQMRRWVPDPESPRRVQPARYEARDCCLLPAEWGAQLARQQRDSGTFSREKACSDASLELLRIGHPFVDMLSRLILWDDRGRAFAFCSHLAHWPAGQCEAYFRLDCVIETDLERAREAVRACGWDRASARPLLRRADGWFPPEMRTLFVDPELRVVTDPERLRLLRLPYQSRDNGGCDYNLNHKRLGTLDRVISLERWPQLCRQIRQGSEQVIRQDAALQARAAACSERAVQDLELRMEQLRRGLHIRSHRQSQVDEEAFAALEAERGVYTALIEGIRNPSVKLDAVGLILLSGDCPDGTGVAGAE